MLTPSSVPRFTPDEVAPGCHECGKPMRKLLPVWGSQPSGVEMRCFNSACGQRPGYLAAHRTYPQGSGINDWQK